MKKTARIKIKILLVSPGKAQGRIKYFNSKLTGIKEYRDKVVVIHDLDASEVITKLHKPAGIIAETGGISLAAATALLTGLPWVYIRKQRKVYSTKALLEGSFKIKSNALLVDDVLASGDSKNIFLRNTKGKINVKCIAVILNDNSGAYEK